LKHLIISFIFLLILTINGFAQKKKNYLPIWSYHQKNVNIYGLSVGIGSFFEPVNTNSYGVKIELIGAGILAPLIGSSPTITSDSLQNIEMSKPRDEYIYGLNLSAAGSVCDCQINGVSVGLIGHIDTQVNGLSGALIMNYSQIHNGLQAAMFTETYKMTGVQIGLRNNAYKSWGVQIGLFNDSEEMYGLQLGLWNVNQKRKLPLINWNFRK
jgi:hypothetical protein